MFFHGIDLKYLLKQYPCLYPDAHVSSKNETQLKDRIHLIEKFGFEPVHLLEATKEYPIRKCLEECFSFGEIVFAFNQLKAPLWQISDHEIAVSYLNVNHCEFIVVKSNEVKEEMTRMFINKLIFLF